MCADPPGRAATPPAATCSAPRTPGPPLPTGPQLALCFNLWDSALRSLIHNPVCHSHCGPLRASVIAPARADPSLCRDRKKLALIRQDVALSSGGTSRGPGIPMAMYTHNQFTIVNYPELLDKQRPLPLFLVSAKTPGQEKEPSDHHVLTGLPGGQQLRALRRRREAAAASCRRAAARLPLGCTAGRAGHDGDAREPHPAGRRRHRRGQPPAVGCRRDQAACRWRARAAR